MLCLFVAAVLVALADSISYSRRNQYQTGFAYVMTGAVGPINGSNTIVVVFVFRVAIVAVNPC